MAELWRERTPPDFVFDIKAHALMTGQPTETKRLPKSIREELPAELAAKARIYARDLPAELRDAVWQMFLDGLEPLREAGQLGSILLQYPKWFFPISESRDEILEPRASGWAAIRSRSSCATASWFNEKNVERTMRFLTDNKLPFVMVDEPQGFKSSVPPSRRGDLAGARGDALPRPQRGHWEAKGITPAERFRYLYDREELARLGARARRRRQARRATCTCS